MGATINSQTCCVSAITTIHEAGPFALWVTTATARLTSALPLLQGEFNSIKFLCLCCRNFYNLLDERSFASIGLKSSVFNVNFKKFM